MAYIQQPNLKGFYPNNNFTIGQSMVNGEPINNFSLPNQLFSDFQQPPQRQISQEINPQIPPTFFDYEIPTQQVKKTDRLVNWVLYFCPFLFSIIIAFVDANILYNRVQKSKEVNAADNVLDFVEKNLMLDPIQSIISIPLGERFVEHHLQLTSNQCPDNYNIATLGVWPGIQAGCICSGGQARSQTYCLAHFSSGCEKVKELSPINMQVWKKSKLCVKFYDNWKWVGVQGDCNDENLKKCSGGICVPIKSSCPITDLQKKNGQLTIGNRSFESIIKDDIQPVVGFVMTPGGKLHAPCFNDLISPEFQSGEYYPLQNQPAQGCDKFGMSSRYTISLDSYSVRGVYDDNQLTDILLQEPQYEKFIISGDSYTLQAMRRIKIGSSHKCYSINGRKVNEIRVRSDTVHNYTKYLSTFGIILCLVSVLFFPILYILRKKHFDTCNMENINQFKMFYFLGVVIAFLCIIMGVIYLIQVDSRTGLKVLHNEFQEYLRNDCFVDIYIQKAVQSIDKFATDSYHETNFWILFAFSSSIIYILGSVILLLVRHFSFREGWFLDPWK